ncbi:MAG: fibrobacter succinogenes major paralogous domain-containing protein [Fibrobacter sp.]|nr:fibrobacter succinogenes major paralogous domain-containing protein [Fibrobacter sp.]
MKKNFLALGTCAFALALGLVACDDSTSANGSSGDENPAEESSSSVILSDSEGSSSSVTSSSSVESSSSIVSSSSEKSSSSVASSSSVKSSSSVASSSSAKSSSSSVVSSSSSSSAPTEDPSDSKLAWQYLNPDIDYGEFTDTRDGQVYKTIKICDKENKNCQTWMAQNLNYAYTGVKYNYDGHTSDSTSWCGGGSGATAGDCSKYGRLYTWAAAVDSVAIYEKHGEECGYYKSCTRFSASALATAPVRGVCPSGWHLPSVAEWGALYTNVGGTDYAGQKLMANTSLWYSNTGTDEYGFSVLPAGSRIYNGDFYNRGAHACFWSSTEDEDLSSRAWFQYFFYYYDDVSQRSYRKSYGFSVRCLKD